MDDPLISVSINGQTLPLSFSTFDELEDWIGKEQEFWQWIQPLTGQDGQLHPLWIDSHNNFSLIRNLIQSYRSNEASNHRTKVLSKIHTVLSDLYNIPQILLSSSPEALYTKKVAESSPFVAAYILYGFINKNPQQQITTGNAIKGITLAILFQKGVSPDSVDAHTAALDLASRQWRDFQTRAENDDAKRKISFDKLADEFASWHVTQKESHEQVAIKAQTNFDDIAKRAQDNFGLIQTTYNEQLGLQAPVTYWDEQAKSYLRTAIWFSGAAIVVAGLSAFFVWLEIQALVIPFSDVSEKDPHQFGVHAWRYAFVIATAAFLVWPIRILVRILLSAVHLRIDARERSTLAKTYLSLLNRNEGLDQNDRRLILEVLFRPSSSGIVKDDAAPASVIQFLSRLGSGDKK
ncbi:MAG: DUF6161 domain-containing protein [Nitrospira sp.]|nr:DUF6161 domain-containing protein [Nitrospira sp.]